MDIGRDDKAARDFRLDFSVGGRERVFSIGSSV